MLYSWYCGVLLCDVPVRLCVLCVCVHACVCCVLLTTVVSVLLFPQSSHIGCEILLPIKNERPEKMMSGPIVHPPLSIESFVKSVLLLVFAMCCNIGRARSIWEKGDVSQMTLSTLSPAKVERTGKAGKGGGVGSGIGIQLNTASRRHPASS